MDVMISFKKRVNETAISLRSTGLLMTFSLIFVSTGIQALPATVIERGLEGRSDIILFSDFNSSTWYQDWGLGAQPFPLKNEIISTDPTRQFQAFDGSALRIQVTQGTHYGTSFRYNFQNQTGSEPEEIYLRYYLRFGDDWNPLWGGKLPGIAGTYGRAGWGGRRPNGFNGWSARGNFWSQRDGVTPIGSYVYNVDQGGTWGNELVWDNRNQAAHLENNRWYAVEQYVKMNTPGQNDGIVRGWIDGELVFERTDLRFRDTFNLKIHEIWMNVYYGGGTPASSDHHMYIDNLVIAHNYIGPIETLPFADTIKPTVPTRLEANIFSSTQLNLSWQASHDNIGVTGYRIYRNNTLISTTTNLFFSDTGLTPGVAHTYTVTAFDAAGNQSAWSAPAATQSISIIRENCTGFVNCYTSLFAWEAAENKDLTAVNQIAIARIEGSWVNPDASAFTIDGWTTSVNNYIKIYTSSESRHSGVWDDAKYRLVVTDYNSNAAIRIQDKFVSIVGLQVETAGAINDVTGIASSRHSNFPTVSHNIIRNTNTGTGVDGVHLFLSAPFHVYNNIVYDFNTTGSSGFNLGASGNQGNNKLFSNTAYNNSIGINIGTSNTYRSVELRNNLSLGNATDFAGRVDFIFGFQNMNASTDQSASTLRKSRGSLTGLTPEANFINPAARNLRLRAGAPAIDAAANLSAERALSFATDIEGQIRSAVWDMGADEYGSVISPPKPPTNINIILR